MEDAKQCLMPWKTPRETNGLSVIQGIYNLAVENNMLTTIKIESDTHIDILANTNRLHLLTLYISTVQSALCICYLILILS